MSVMSLRQNIMKILFDENLNIALEMAVKTGSVHMYDAIARGSKNISKIYWMKKGDVIQVRNVVWRMRYKAAMQGDDKDLQEEEISGEDESEKRMVKKVKQQRNKFARFRLQVDVDDDSALHESLRL